MTTPDVRATSIAQQAAIPPAELVETDDVWNEDRDHCRATPADNTARYEVERQWHQRLEEWNGEGIG